MKEIKKNNRCKYCQRKATRYYNKKHLCELHYLKENPSRNRWLVDWEKINQMRMLERDTMFVLEEERLVFGGGIKDKVKLRAKISDKYLKQILKGEKKVEYRQVESIIFIDEQGKEYEFEVKDIGNVTAYTHKVNPQMIGIKLGRRIL